MAFNGSGSYSLPAGQPVVTSTTISSTVFNTLTSDIATAFNLTLCRDGQAVPTANLPMGGFKLTGLAAGTAAGNSVRYEQVFSVQALTDGATISWNTASGSVGTVTLGDSRTMAAPTNLTAGARYGLIITQDGTGGRTLTWNSVFKGQGGGVMPQPETTAGAVTFLSFISDGTNLYTDETTPFIDTNYIVRGASDPTKKVRLEVDGLTTATTRVLTIQDSDQTLVGRTTTDTLTNKTLTSPVLDTGISGTAIAAQSDMDTGTSTSLIVTPGRNRISLGTESTTTGGATIDFTGIPAGTRRISIVINGLSLSGTENLMIQLGDTDGFENSGYTGALSTVSAGAVGGPTAFSAGFLLSGGSTAAALHYAKVDLVLESAAAFRWGYSGVDGSSVPTNAFSGGTKALSAELTQVRITTTGADTFDLNGGINIAYER